MSAGDVRRDTGREPAGGRVRAHRGVPGGVLARDAPARGRAGAQCAATPAHAPAQSSSPPGRPQSQRPAQQHTSR